MYIKLPDLNIFPKVVNSKKEQLRHNVMPLCDVLVTLLVLMAHYKQCAQTKQNAWIGDILLIVDVSYYFVKKLIYFLKNVDLTLFAITSFRYNYFL